MPLPRLIEALSTRPAEIFGLPGGTLKAGAKADLAIADLEMPWVVHEQDIISTIEEYSPFEGERFSGKIVRTIVSGKTVYEIED